MWAADRGEELAAAAAAFRRDHPRPVLLLLMRFDEKPAMQKVRHAIAAGAARHGFDLVRADDHDYTGEIWTNVELYIHHSDLIVCVLEDIERRDCDANVMVELGYALACARRCVV